MIPIAKPFIGEAEIETVTEVLRSGMLAQGEKVATFEDRFAEAVGAKGAVAVGNGTQALHLSLLAQGIGPGKVVATSPFTFISTVSAILMTGAEVAFIDIDSWTFNMDVALLKAELKRGRVDAVLPVHLYGLPAHMMWITDGCPVPLIWDACQAHGAFISDNEGILHAVGDPGVSGYSALSCWSFYATKNMTTGEGGMITYNEPSVGEYLRRLRNHGQKDRYSYAMLGYNYRMTEMQAAIGLVQLDKLWDMLKHRKAVAEFYDLNLRDDSVIQKPFVPDGHEHAWHQYTIKVIEGRDSLLSHLHEAGIGARVYYPEPLHRLPMFQASQTIRLACPVAERMAAQVLSLPINACIELEEAQEVVEAVNAWNP
jgi:dTDP-4-amino-4,6-dideoxygalactose transaminase